MLGVETIAHVRENGRITIMFCAFEGPPRITRLFGRGTHCISCHCRNSFNVDAKGLYTNSAHPSTNPSYPLIKDNQARVL